MAGKQKGNTGGKSGKVPPLTRDRLDSYDWAPLIQICVVDIGVDEAARLYPCHFISLPAPWSAPGFVSGAAGR